MPSSYSSSGRYTLQATGENNNTWGVILNNGVFQLVDDNINGRLAFTLSGPKLLTTVLGGTDEARYAFLDVTGGSGGTITIPPVPKGYFVRNNAAGQVRISVGGPIDATFDNGDMGPCFTDGSGAVFQIYLGNLKLKDYIQAQVTGGSDLPAPVGNLGKVMIVRNPGPLWVPDFVFTTDVQNFEEDVSELAIAFAVAL